MDDIVGRWEVAPLRAARVRSGEMIVDVFVRMESGEILSSVAVVLWAFCVAVREHCFESSVSRL